MTPPTISTVQATRHFVTPKPPLPDRLDPVPFFAHKAPALPPDPVYDRVRTLPPGPHGVPDFDQYFRAVHPPTKHRVPLSDTHPPTECDSNSAIPPPSPLLIKGTQFKWFHPAVPESDVSSQASSYITISEPGSAHLTPSHSRLSTTNPAPAPEAAETPVPPEQPNMQQTPTPAALPAIPTPPATPLPLPPSPSPSPSPSPPPQSPPRNDDGPEPSDPAAKQDSVDPATPVALKPTPADAPDTSSTSGRSSANPNKSAIAESPQKSKSASTDQLPRASPTNNQPASTPPRSPHDRDLSTHPQPDNRLLGHAATKKVSDFDVTRRVSAASAPALLPSWVPPSPPPNPTQVPTPTQATATAHEDAPDVEDDQEEFSTPIVARSAAGNRNGPTPQPVTVATETPCASQSGAAGEQEAEKDCGLVLEYASTASPQSRCDSRQVTLGSLSRRVSIAAGSDDRNEQMLDAEEASGGNAVGTEEDQSEATPMEEAPTEDGAAEEAPAGEAPADGSRAEQAPVETTASTAAGFHVLSRCRRGVVQCEAEGVPFLLSVAGMQKPEVGELSIQCNAEDILLDMRDVFGVHGPPRSVGVQTDLKATPAAKTAPSSQDVSPSMDGAGSSSKPGSSSTSVLHSTPEVLLEQTEENNNRATPPALIGYESASVGTFSTMRQPAFIDYQSSAATPSTRHRESVHSDAHVTPSDVGVQVEDDEVCFVGAFPAAERMEDVGTLRTLREMLPPVQAGESLERGERGEKTLEVSSYHVARQARRERAPRPITLPELEQESTSNAQEAAQGTGEEPAGMESEKEDAHMGNSDKSSVMNPAAGSEDVPDEMQVEHVSANDDATDDESLCPAPEAEAVTGEEAPRNGEKDATKTVNETFQGAAATASTEEEKEPGPERQEPAPHPVPAEELPTQTVAVAPCEGPPPEMSAALNMQVQQQALAPTPAAMSMVPSGPFAMGMNMMSMQQPSLTVPWELLQRRVTVDKNSNIGLLEFLAMLQNNGSASGVNEKQARLEKSSDADTAATAPSAGLNGVMSGGGVPSPCHEQEEVQAEQSVDVICISDTEEEREQVPSAKVVNAEIVSEKTEKRAPSRGMKESRQSATEAPRRRSSRLQAVAASRQSEPVTKREKAVSRTAIAGTNAVAELEERAASRKQRGRASRSSRARSRASSSQPEAVPRGADDEGKVEREAEKKVTAVEYAAEANNYDDAESDRGEVDVGGEEDAMEVGEDAVEETEDMRRAEVGGDTASFGALLTPTEAGKGENRPQRSAKVVNVQETLGGRVSIEPSPDAQWYLDMLKGLEADDEMDEAPLGRRRPKSRSSGVELEEEERMEAGEAGAVEDVTIGHENGDALMLVDPAPLEMKEVDTQAEAAPSTTSAGTARTASHGRAAPKARGGNKRKRGTGGGVSSGTGAKRRRRGAGPMLREVGVTGRARGRRATAGNARHSAEEERQQREPAGAGPAAVAVRRSRRQRFPVLKYWKNETVQFERRASQLLPTVSEVIIDVGDADPSQSWAPSRR